MTAAPLLSARGLSKAIGARSLFSNIDLTIEPGARIGLLGLNGTGKSSLLRVLAGIDAPDSGIVERRTNGTFEFLAQEPVLDGSLTAREIARSGLKDWHDAQERFQEISRSISAGKSDDALVSEQSALAETIEHLGGWAREHEVDQVLDKLGIHAPDQLIHTLSGGELRRVALAHLLVAKPDVAILDEPTNHLDADTIRWLEAHVRSEFTGAVLLVTHDRYFLDAVCTGILELDQGELFSYEGGYTDFLEQKAERLALREREETVRLNLLRREQAWLLRGAKARTTKQKARIDRAHDLIAQAPPPKATSVALGGLEGSASRTGKTIIECDDLTVAREGRALVHNLTLHLVRGDRIGIIGPNGAGKSSLLAVITGDLEPVKGTVRVGQNTRFGQLDQTRAALEDDWSVYDNVAGWKGAEVTGGGKVALGEQEVDLRVYLERFLFRADRQRQFVHSLSGGERARVALAKTLRSQANVLLLDEPTNDLDTFTLSALEELLETWPGCVLVVSHDRYFLDRVCNRIVALDGNGGVVVYAGNYDTYERWKAEEEREREIVPADSPKVVKKYAEATSGLKALTYAERIELDGIMERIGDAERRVEAAEVVLTDTNLYSQGADAMKKAQEEQVQASRALEGLMKRWEELEGRNGIKR